MSIENETNPATNPLTAYFAEIDQPPVPQHQALVGSSNGIMSILGTTSSQFDQTQEVQGQTPPAQLPVQPTSSNQSQTGEPIKAAATTIAPTQLVPKPDATPTQPVTSIVQHETPPQTIKEEAKPEVQFVGQINSIKNLIGKLYAVEQQNHQKLPGAIIMIRNLEALLNEYPCIIPTSELPEFLKVETMIKNVCDRLSVPYATIITPKMHQKYIEYVASQAKQTADAAEATKSKPISVIPDKAVLIEVTAEEVFRFKELVDTLAKKQTQLSIVDRKLLEKAQQGLSKCTYKEWDEILAMYQTYNIRPMSLARTFDFYPDLAEFWGKYMNIDLTQLSSQEQAKVINVIGYLTNNDIRSALMTINPTLDNTQAINAIPEEQLFVIMGEKLKELLAKAKAEWKKIK